MKLKKLKLAPTLIATAVIGIVCLFQILPDYFPRFEVFQRLEGITYDWRVSQASKRPHFAATNLAAVFINNESLTAVNEESKFTWPWPRMLHGRLVRELHAQGAKAVGFDILFSELHPITEETSIPISDQETVSSDDFFERQLRQSSNVVLAVMGEMVNNKWRAVPPNDFFRTNTFAIGHITSETDSDGVLRRALPFRFDPELGRIWHMGIVLAASELNIDLEKAVIQPGKIILRGENNVERIIPIDKNGFFYINWSLPWNSPSLFSLPFSDLLELDKLRQAKDVEGFTNYLDNLRANGWPGIKGESPFKDKLVVVGSIAEGNNISDMGATPLEKQTFLVSKHWNVANSVITGDFIKPSSTFVSLLLIVFLGVLAAVLTWKLRALAGSFSVVTLMAAYIALSFYLFIQYRFWIPMVLPVIGALLMTHVCVVTYRVVVEQNERRRVKAVFDKIVSPNVVTELLGAEKLLLGGSRRKITIFFADVRGFTEMTDAVQAKADAYVRDNKLSAVDAEAHYDKIARETLETVNLYIGIIADTIKKHNGTVDKYIGDCVMAFWGAPTANEQHALGSVRAAIDAQRAMQVLNQERSLVNKKRELENEKRKEAGQPPLDMLATLSLGSGINSGYAIVGLMGSDAHILNYTVFGREVNLASRLEGLSGRGRIVIGESTYEDLKRYDPVLAATCILLPPAEIKGFRDATKMKNYEVPWKIAESSEVKSTPPSGAAKV